MKSHNHFPVRAGCQRGFTLIEILIVVAMLIAVGVMTIFMGQNSISRGVVYEERDTLVLLLQGARARALANVNELDHGVHLEAYSYTVFEGDSYATSDPAKNWTVERNNSVVLDPVSTDIIFDQLSGDVTTGADIYTLTNSAFDLSVQVDHNGRIEW